MEDKAKLPAGTHQLFWYTFLAVVLCAIARVVSFPFMPIFIVQRLHMSESVVGAVLATYSLASLLSTPFTSRIACNTTRINWLYFVALILYSLVNLLFSASEALLSVCGVGPVLLVMIVLRALQGVCFNLFFAVNTTLVTRRFPDHVPYVMAMNEVAVGCGGQIGRVIGGVLYDAGGFECPFLTVACFLAVWAFSGLAFLSRSTAIEPSKLEYSKGESESQAPSLLSLLTGRTYVALIGIFTAFYGPSFLDTTLPIHLENHLGPVSVSVIGLTQAFRSVTYLISCYICAQIVKKSFMSLEAQLIIGFTLCVVGMIFVAPLPFITNCEAWVASREIPSHEAAWITQLLALFFLSSGISFTFTPSLPLMQAESRHRGQAAVEACTTLLMLMMTLGEGMGAIFGGWLSQTIGFQVSTGLYAAATAIALTLASFFYDAQVISLRSIRASFSTETALTKPLQKRRLSAENLIGAFGGREHDDAVAGA